MQIGLCAWLFIRVMHVVMWCACMYIYVVVQCCVDCSRSLVSIIWVFDVCCSMLYDVILFSTRCLCFMFV